MTDATEPQHETGADTPRDRTDIDLVDYLMQAVHLLGMQVAELLASRPSCRACTAEAHTALRNGTPAEAIPQPNPLNLIVDGQGQCFGHVQFTDRPIVPGQTPSGLFVPGQGM